jgi:hypothetical protein
MGSFGAIGFSVSHIEPCFQAAIGPNGADWMGSIVKEQLAASGCERWPVRCRSARGISAGLCACITRRGALQSRDMGERKQNRHDANKSGEEVRLLVCGAGGPPRFTTEARRSRRRVGMRGRGAGPSKGRAQNQERRARPCVLRSPLSPPTCESRLCITYRACLEAAGVCVRQSGAVVVTEQIESVGTEERRHTARRAWMRNRREQTPPPLLSVISGISVV